MTINPFVLLILQLGELALFTFGVFRLLHEHFHTKGNSALKYLIIPVGLILGGVNAIKIILAVLQVAPDYVSWIRTDSLQQPSPLLILAYRHINVFYHIIAIGTLVTIIPFSFPLKIYNNLRSIAKALVWTVIIGLTTTIIIALLFRLSFN